MADCTTKPTGNVCAQPSAWTNCRPWDITEQTRTNCYADALSQEALGIAGAPVNVHKLLGVHEQTKLVDLTGSGNPISGGDAPNYPKAHAYNVFSTEWRSLQTGSTAVCASAYIGYDFGVIKLANGRNKYGVPAPKRELVTAFKIKQSANAVNRVTKVRVERSDNGRDWYGVAVATLPDNDALNQIFIKQSTPSQFWRIRPLAFNGQGCDSWGVRALEMYDYTLTHESNIQDQILLENRDRDYSPAPVLIKGYYELQSAYTDLSRFGIELQAANYQIRVNFSATVAAIGRPVVIGDIIELPSETQYTPDLKPVKKYIEVTDVTWDSSSFTPGWMPTMLLITAQPALATQETQDIFGDLSKTVDTSGLFSTDDGNNTKYQDMSGIDQTIRAAAADAVPQRGSEGSNVIREFEPEELAQATAENFPTLGSMGLNRVGLYVEDAIPQNGAKYTESPTFPESPKNGEYHRLTYEGLAKDVPARLYRWSSVKNRWIYLETDRRTQHNNQKATLEEYTTSPTKKFARGIK